jgi:hypothetical protein
VSDTDLGPPSRMGNGLLSKPCDSQVQVSDT